MKRHSFGVIPFRSAPRPCLQLPLALPPHIKAAQVSALPQFESVQPFRRERWQELAAFEPNVLVGYGFDLQRLAEKVRSQRMSLPSLNRTIFALTDCGANPISDPLREILWRTFGVPVYELIVAPGCALLAAECEAHDGYHLRDGAEAYLVGRELVCDAPPLTALRTGFTGDIETSPCACGADSARLKNLTPHLPRPHEQWVAAAA